MEPAEELLLIALYNEVSTRDDDVRTLQYLDEHYRLSGAVSIEDVAGSLLDAGMLDLRLNDNEDFTPVSLTHKGRVTAEDLIEHGKRVQELSSFSDGASYSDGSRHSTSTPAISSVIHDPDSKWSVTHSSQAWTGRVVSEQQRMALAADIRDALLRLDNVQISNKDRAQGHALLAAALTLAKAPEPPFDIIQILLQNFDRIVGIAALVIGLADFMRGQG